LSTFIKPLIALVISILLFAGLIFLAHGNLLDFVESHFFNPSVVNSYVKENAVDSQIVQKHINNLKSKFYATLTIPAIRSSFLYNQSPNDIFERSKVYGILMESTSGLQSVQFVDSNGIRIHYSTSARDIMSQDQKSTAYRNYNENPTSLPYETVGVEDANHAKLIMDDQNDRIIFSYPFRDSMDVFRGTALFSVSIRAFTERLVEAGRLKISDNVSIINEPSGIILGSPETSKTAILKRVAEAWNEGIKDYITLDAEDSGAAFSLISTKTDQNLFFGRLVNSDLFSISEPMKLILNVSIFLTFFLTFFFLINLKPNPVAVVRNRIRRLRESFFEQIGDDKSVQEKAKLVLELEQRQDEIYSQLKRGIKLNRRLEAILNGIIDKSWEEILIYLKVSSGHELSSIHTVKGIAKKAEAKIDQKPEEVDVIDEVETLEAEEVDKITEAEPLEEIDEVEALEEAEPIEEIEEAESIEEVEALEEIEEIGEIEEAEPIEEIEEIEPLEEIEEAEAIESAKPPPKKAEKPQKAEKPNIIDIALRAAMEPEPRRGGLFGRASKINEKKSSAAAGKGLLNKASKKAAKKAAGKGLLARAGELEKPASKGKGLLAKANKRKRRGKGLLAYADEMGAEDSNEEIHAQDLNINVDIVSPFSSMFSSLSEKE
jgi:hypothetical protein